MKIKFKRSAGFQTLNCQNNMNCQEVHNWIRESDEINPPQAMLEHLKECKACSVFYSQVSIPKGLKK